MLAIGIDIGGTFTDLVTYDTESGVLAEAKSLSTPDDPTAAIFAGLEALGVPLARAEKLVHGTTRVTNALLEGKGAQVGVLTTAGFRDVLEMGLGHRPHLYRVKEAPRQALTARTRRRGVRERMRADGSVDVPLDREDLDAAIGALAAAGTPAIAICFLHAYRNPAHEREAAARVAELYPAAVCSASADVIAVHGEYERFATTVLNASVRGIVSSYLDELGSSFAARGYSRPISIITSSGGVVAAAEASRLPIHLALSGPAGGVAASASMAEMVGARNVITCDIGGTSTDVCLIKDGQPFMTNQGQIAGYPNSTFQIEINTIGAGGGSVAWRDVGGELRVGPRSAGSKPGPACYGAGGTEPTTTDAHLLVGHLDPGESLGGQVAPRHDLASAAMRALAAEFGGEDETRLAHGILRLAAAKMTSAIKEISIARGHDPRDFVLMPYGGAGPMHATALADELGILEILVPAVPGTFSALGFVTARARHDYVCTVLAAADDDGLALARAAVDELEARAREQMAAEDGLDPDRLTFRIALGMRFRGQSFDVTVALDGLPATGAELLASFHAAYAARYSYVRPEQDAELVSCRLTAFGPPSPVRLSAPKAKREPRSTSTRIHGADGWLDAKVWRRDELPCGFELAGPAVVRERGSTTVVGVGWVGAVDELGNLRLRRA